MRKSRLLFLVLIFGALPVPCLYAQDVDGNGIADRFDLPGTQPNRILPAYHTNYNIDVEVLDAAECERCHTRDNRGPFRPWSGSMMGNSARDPVFWAQLDLAEGDEKMNPARMAGARDLCLRCHIPKGWLEGRSSGDTDALRGMKMHEADLFGVQCEVCHRMVDPDMSTADEVDKLILEGLNTHPDPDLRIPSSYGVGMYAIDRTDVRRGPYSYDQIGWPFLRIMFTQKATDWPPGLRHVKNHFTKESRFHRSSNLCGTCHDVSNPAWTPEVPKGDAQGNFPIERTWTEWKHSRYSTLGEAGNCQSCHMSGPLNGVIDGGTSVVVHDPAIHLNDVHVHDFTGGNVWIPRFIAEMVTRFDATKSADPGDNPVIGATQKDRDFFLKTYYAEVVRALYPAGTFAPAHSEDLDDWFWYDKTAYEDASDRAKATLKRAAELSTELVDGDSLKVRVWNKTGHKLPTGYPEGRRMWLDVRFLDIDKTSGEERLIAQSGEYDYDKGVLYHDFNLDNKPGPFSYDVVSYTDGKGNPLAMGRLTQVYESRSHHAPSHKEFHFILNNEVLKDNRIPPLGWNKKEYQNNSAQQVIRAAYKAHQMEYHDATTGPAVGIVEESYNFDEVAYPVPPHSDVAEITLKYQSVSKEYVEELVAGNPRLLVYPEGSGKRGITRADILEHGWRTFDFEGKKHIPPIDMAKLRVALVDTDGDGLPDNWERSRGLNPNSTEGESSRHGDIDGNGRSNYQEFQDKTTSHGTHPARKPLDLALVLDYSGSMEDPAPSGRNSSIDALRNSVELFLKTWKQYAIRDDRIAIVYYSSTVDVEDGDMIDLSKLPVGISIEEKVDQLIDAMRARKVGGFSAMGGGLQKALKLLQTGGSDHRKHIILFSNGMQNYNPVVQRDQSNNIIVSSVTVSDEQGVYGDSGVTDADGPAFGTPLNTLGIQIHTIGMGVSPIADNRWIDIVKGIADDTRGSHFFSPRESDLEGVFLHGFIESLRGASPVMVAEHSDNLKKSQDSKTFDFQMDAAAKKATFVLSWAGAETQRSLDFELITPEGKSAQDLGRLTRGTNYLIGTYYFPLSQDNSRPVIQEGVWKMKVHPQSSSTDSEKSLPWPDQLNFRTYLLVDISQMEFLFLFSKIRYAAGDEVELEAVVLDRFEPIRTQRRVTATITRLSQGVGTLLSKTPLDMNKIRKGMDVNGDTMPDLAASKARLALMDSDFLSAIELIREEIELHDDGNPEHGDFSANDGLFSAKLDIAQVPGLLYADVGIVGNSARTKDFTRRLRVVSLVEHGEFSPDKSMIRGSKLRRAEDEKWKIQIIATPVDKLNNYLGPGYSHLVSIDIAGYTMAADVQDRLDGSYAKEFILDQRELEQQVIITVKDDRIYKGPVAALIQDSH